MALCLVVGAWLWSQLDPTRPIAPTLTPEPDALAAT
jgi:hypothetical protein